MGSFPYASSAVVKRLYLWLPKQLVTLSVPEQLPLKNPVWLAPGNCSVNLVTSVPSHIESLTLN